MALKKVGIEGDMLTDSGMDSFGSERQTIANNHLVTFTVSLQYTDEVNAVSAGTPRSLTQITASIKLPVIVKYRGRTTKNISWQYLRYREKVNTEGIDSHKDALNSSFHAEFSRTQLGAS